jgi:hypothetical protein
MKLKTACGIGDSGEIVSVQRSLYLLESKYNNVGDIYGKDQGDNPLIETMEECK